MFQVESSCSAFSYGLFNLLDFNFLHIDNLVFCCYASKQMPQAFA